MHSIRKAGWFIALCILLTGCSPAPSVQSQTSAMTAIPTLPATVVPTAMPTAITGTATAVPATAQVTVNLPETATPETALPTISQQITTAVPATAKPAAQGKYEYYIVEQNGRQGVVDGKGKAVLPFKFSIINTVVYQRYNYEDHEIIPQGPLLFLVRPVKLQIGGETDETVNPPIDPNLNYLYNTQGKLISKKGYASAHATSKDLIQVSIWSESALNYLWGVITADGKTVVSCNYDLIYLFENGNIMACKGEGEQRIVTILNHQGAVLRTKKVNAIRTVSNLMVMQDANLCGLMDDRFQWVAPAAWEEISESSPDRYIVTLRGVSGVINTHGDPIIPVSYRGLYGIPDPSHTGHMLYPAMTEKGVLLLDDTGTVLFESSLYEHINYRSGVFLVSGKETAAALDLNGQPMLSGIPHISDWSSKYQLFQCWEGNKFYCYTADGRMLPLPESDTGYIVTGNRFVLANSNKRGLCDAQGQWIIPPEPQSFQPVGSGENTLLIRIQNDTVYTLIDLDGRAVTNQKFDLLNASASYQNLLHARIGAMHGLIDLDGNWVWYTSDYNSLMD